MPRYSLTQTDGTIRRDLGTHDTIEAAEAALVAQGWTIRMAEHDTDNPGCVDIFATRSALQGEIFSIEPSKEA